MRQPPILITNIRIPPTKGGAIIRRISADDQTGGFKLSSVSLEPAWPVLPAPVLALSELEQDEVFPFLDKDQITTYLHRALSIGRQAAREFQYDGRLKTLLNPGLLIIQYLVIGIVV